MKTQISERDKTLVTTEHGDVHIYAVGFLRDFLMLKNGQRSFKHTWSWFKESWKRRNYWNGYLAEPREMPMGIHKCGKGWTKRAALRDWQLRLDTAGYGYWKAKERP